MKKSSKRRDRVKYVDPVTSPEHVLKQLNDYKSQYELEADDELWLVVDKDRWTEAMLSRVATECSQEIAMHMALSNPCFELWLLLHLEDAASLTPEEQTLWMENHRKSKNADPYLKVRLRQKMGSYQFLILLLAPHFS